MHKSIRPRRSVLYMPGSNTRALDKAGTLPADGLIMDLEDAVAPDAKTRARNNVMAAISAGGYGQRELVIRVNGLNTPWGEDDIKAVAGSCADAVLLPKIDTAQAVVRTLSLLDQHGARNELAVWVMAETAAGVLNIREIVAADPRLAVIVMGTSDLAKELRIPPTPGRLGMLAALSGCVLAARARGLDILDGVHGDIADTSGFSKACEQGRTLGFDGKTLIHPGQIEIANRVFGISGEQLAKASEIIAAWEAAVSENRGIAVVNGRMIEELHAADARRVLSLAAAIKRLEEE